MTRRKGWNARLQAERAGKFHFKDGSYMSAAAKADAERLLGEVPADTRGFTERLLGDPLPGRRAIDRREGSA